MADKLGHVTHNGVVYEVILDERGFAWYIDPFNNALRAKTNVGQREGGIGTIEEAKEAVILMLKSMGR